jgi:hypothetical protein
VLHDEHTPSIVLDQGHRADHEGRVEDAQEYVPQPAREGHIPPDAQESASAARRRLGVHHESDGYYSILYVSGSY